MTHQGERVAGLLSTCWGLQAALLLVAILILATLIGMAVYRLASQS